MFRLPFAAGRVFSISMLDTLLYQVGGDLGDLETLGTPLCRDPFCRGPSL